MILVLFGQPRSGKSTIANELKGMFMNIDGDRLRKIFKNNDLLSNLNRASDIAAFIDASGLDVVLSLGYPYKEARDYLNSLSNDVYWVYLEYDDKDIRRHEVSPMDDFDYPGEDEKVLKINTTKTSLTKCLSQIEDYINHL
jgi:adenylylsulfate kinase-like enzyme|tara:strand:+ start:3722 stop:4144 length:423 start_codon:yes stop_codon:yes gene_type:complete